MGSLRSLLVAAAALLQLGLASPTPVAQMATSSRTTPTQIAASGACATLIRQYSAARASATPQPTLSAKVGYDCLREMPFNQTGATILMDGLQPYLEFDATLSWVKQPPPDYEANVQKPYDFWAAWNNTRQKVNSRAYDCHFDWETEFSGIAAAVKQAHFYINLPSKDIMSFRRSTPLVTVSMNGSTPEVFARDDIIEYASGHADYKPSAVTQINGQDAVDAIMKWGQLVTPAQDPDAIYNTQMYSLSHTTNDTTRNESDDWSSGYTGNVYPGPTTTLRFRNGTVSTTDNMAIITRDISVGTKLGGYYSYPYWVTHSVVQDAINNPNRPYYPPASAATSSRYPQASTSGRSRPPQAAASPTGEAKANAAASESDPAAPTDAIDWVGYPKPLVEKRGHNVNKGFFMNQKGYDDIAVLVIPTFQSPKDTFETTRQITKKTIAMAKAQGKKKFIIDVSGNGGGLINEGVDVFKQLFPDQQPWAGGQLRATKETNDLGAEIERVLRGANDSATSTSDYKDIYSSYWSYLTGVDTSGHKFDSWSAFAAPHRYGPARDAFTPENQFSLRAPDCELDVSGYCALRDIPSAPPFAAADVLVLTDGYCGSTCSTFAYNMMHVAGVRALAMGGRPGPQRMQAVGATRGGGVAYAREIMTLINATTNVGGAPSVKRWAGSSIDRFALVPAIGGLDAAMNHKIEVARKDVAAQNPTPLQFVYEPADCRLWYTPEMVVDQSAVWRAAADAAWGSARCVGGAQMAKSGAYLEQSDASGGGGDGKKNAGFAVRVPWPTMMGATAAVALAALLL